MSAHVLIVAKEEQNRTEQDRRLVYRWACNEKASDNNLQYIQLVSLPVHVHVYTCIGLGPYNYDVFQIPGHGHAKDRWSQLFQKTTPSLSQMA